MLALTTYKCIYHLKGWIVLYRISAGFCPIIVTRVLFPDTSMIIIDNEPVLFLCPFLNGITKAGFVLPFVKLVVEKFETLFY